MLKNFRAYQSALALHRICERVWAPKHLQDQLLRASSSVALNLAEGSERASDRDQRRFYRMAMAALRECQAILDLAPKSIVNEQAKTAADQTGAMVFNLCRSLDQKMSSQSSSSGPIGDREPRTGNREPIDR